MQKQPVISFTLSPPGLGFAVDVRLRRAGDRWVAQVAGQSVLGVAASAGAALQAALAPLGSSATAVLLADVGLLGPSFDVIEVERATARSA
ncbi:MAG: hypothetical protein M3N29_07465 [Chloroflexota bacterium]|nr:hypothetical protein [Chloroflexota bacterium]